MRVRGSGGSASLELVPLKDGLARCYLRQSPRGLRLTGKEAEGLSSSLAGRGYAGILAQDTRGRFLARTLEERGWSVEKAVGGMSLPRCNITTPHDLPLDEQLIDERGRGLELDGTGQMTGIHVAIDADREAWAFYTDEGETARVATFRGRRYGFAVARDGADIDTAFDSLIRFLVTAKKSWAVFDMDMEGRLSSYHPSITHRMELEDPGRSTHSARPLTKADRRSVTALFSEYYDESTLAASLRLRRYARNAAYSVFVADRGFVIVRREGEVGLIYDIYVAPDRQGEGVGDELMRSALDSLSGQVSSVYLHTGYPRARRLYEKHGFRVASSSLVVRLDESSLTPPST